LIRPISSQVKRIHTDGFIISDTNNNHLQVGSNTGELKCEKIGHVTIKNSINVSWTNTEKISTNLLDKQGKRKKEIILPIELISLIIDHCSKLHPLLFVNKQWNANVCRILWNDIKLKGIAGIKFSSIFGANIKPLPCNFISSIKIWGLKERNTILPYICKACPNLKHLFFIECAHSLVNNKSIFESLVECKNLKSFGILILCPSLEKLVIIDCTRVDEKSMEKMRKSYPLLKIECDY